MKKYFILAIVNFVVITNISLAKDTKHGTGLTFDDGKYKKTLLSAPLLRGEYTDLPTSNSLQKYAPTPKNQGDYGTCVGWSTAYAARTILYSMKKNITTPELATHVAFSPSYVYNQISTDTTCQLGTFLDDALGLMQNEGVASLYDFGYQCNKPVTYIDRELAGNYKIKSFKKLFDIEDYNKIDPVRKSLSENKPVVIGMKCCLESFGTAYGKDVWDVLPTETDPDLGHAMAVIGYDDKKYDGSFLIMNSWGAEWGNGGFIWVRYPDFKRFTKYAFELIEADNGDKLSGELEFVTINGEKMPVKFNKGIYEVTKPYNSGTLFRLYVTNNEPAYIYAIGTDLTAKTFKIFPHKENISPYLGYKNSAFALPDESSYIKMDKTTGTDYFAFLYSKNELDVNNLMQNIESEDGTFQEKIYKVLNNKLIKTEDIDYNKNNKIAFSASSGMKDIVPVIVKMEHK